MLFTCIFAYYVKTCLTPSLDVALEDIKLNESSTIWYQNSGGEWQEAAATLEQAVAMYEKLGLGQSELAQGYRGNLDVCRRKLAEDAEAAPAHD